MYKPKRVIDDLVGNTPVVLLRRVAPVRLKLELRSPNATVMDRVAKVLVREAGPGIWREAGDGALAVAVAMQGALHRHPVEVFLPENTPLEVRLTLQLYRAKVMLTAFALGAQGSLDAARAAGAVLSDRFPRARLESLQQVGRELLDSEERIDAFVAPIGTGATLTAIGPLLRGKFPQVLLVGVRPFAEGWRPHRQAGVLPWPGVEPPLLSSTERVDDETAWKMRAQLGREEGLLVSIGTAAGVEAARRVALTLGPDARVYALASDTGERDFSLAGQF